MTYDKIQRRCCKEENMSSQIKWVHPDIKFVKPHVQHEDDDEDLDEEDAPEAVSGPSDAGAQGSDEKPFLFERLPLEIQSRILTLVFHKEGYLIHCISRLDPHVAPESFPSAEELGDTRSGLKNVFFWGKRECSITQDGINPQKVLGILTVCKRWHWLGTFLFYGLNTFAFSSLGEFARFCQGSGLVRIARIQHIELLYTGNQYLTAPPDAKNRVPVSRRTYALSWLTDMTRLKTLVVHINETGASYIRRRRENSGIQGFLNGKTLGQPNQRMTRSLRCVQGIDYMYNLRGLDFIRFYDFNKALQSGTGERVPVQDWSFTEDMTNTGTMPKVPSRTARCQLDEVDSLLGGDRDFQPQQQDWNIVRPVYVDNNGRCSYDELRLQGLHHDLDMASFGSVVISDDSEEEDTSDMYDDSPSGSGGSDSDPHSGSSSDSDSPGGDQLLQNHGRHSRSSSSFFVDLTDIPSDDESDRPSSSSSSSNPDSDGDSDTESIPDPDAMPDPDSIPDPDHTHDSNSVNESSSDSDDDSDDSDDDSDDSDDYDSDSDSSSFSRSPSLSPGLRTLAQILADGENINNLHINNERRGSTSSGLFVTPAREVKREVTGEIKREGSGDNGVRSGSLLWLGREVVDLTGEDEDEDEDGEEESSGDEEGDEEEEDDDEDEDEDDDNDDDDGAEIMEERNEDNDSDDSDDDLDSVHSNDDSNDNEDRPIMSGNNSPNALSPWSLKRMGSSSLLSGSSSPSGKRPRVASEEEEKVDLTQE